ncbi:MAG: thioredoxin domain-containing protein, partial [Candidatus Bathyarchaeota archaeon]
MENTRVNTMNEKTEDRNPNRLIHEKSPYLLQHANNPVDWYPWSVEAFKRAKLEDKPIFLSIGYASCHWCHVMEKESFENQEVANLLNEMFICIKVDREQRPDIDRTYMRVTQLMSGTGGWPLTILLTPDRKPFYAATYIPRVSRFGRIGMTELIPRINELWKTKRGEIEQSANQITSHLQRGSKITGIVPVENLEPSTLDEAFVYFVDHYDQIYGGFNSAPKFPSAHRLLFLLRYWKRTQREQALHMVEHTLDAMRRGGIFDHIGFGFHRYSTDRRWLVPHFEKMLYDQAMLTIAYLEAYQVTRKEKYKETAEATLTYVLRDLTHPDGGFYAAEDADVDGNEGEFYLWTANNIRNLVPTADVDLMMSIFNIADDGNFEDEATQKKTGTNIFYLIHSLQEISSRRQIPFETLQTRWERVRQILFAARETRPRPGKDDKILTDWNGLMIVALAKAAQIFKEDKFVLAAKNAVAFILENMRNSQGRLYHSYQGGEAVVSGFLDDYAFLIWGLIEVYQTTFEVEYLRIA